MDKPSLTMTLLSCFHSNSFLIPAYDSTAKISNSSSLAASSPVNFPCSGYEVDNADSVHATHSDGTEESLGRVSGTMVCADHTDRR